MDPPTVERICDLWSRACNRELALRVLGLALPYPLTVLSNEVVALLSVRGSLCGRLSWKDWNIPRLRWRWL
jgi:hypothetical protein